jgi:hypothetical protein
MEEVLQVFFSAPGKTWSVLAGNHDGWTPNVTVEVQTLIIQLVGSNFID